MGSDRARITFDPEQQYRSVVMQQGRVTLEADWNESQQIAGEELRSEALDFVGPAGTPDDGYRVIIAPASPNSSPYDLQVLPGTMYVGGVRARLDATVLYSNQTEWQDAGTDGPDWVDASSFDNPPANEFVYLSMREQEIGAVEDPDLRDNALGGPDTAQRTRIVQRIVRVASPGADCASGLTAAAAQWQTEGLLFNAQTMRLASPATLQVSAANQAPTPNPCQPLAQGGYLDPDNQLIRVQISSLEPQTQPHKLLWGFDNASFLYRIDVDPNNPQNLVLESSPVDSYHQPVRGQAVEVLRTAADLPNGAHVAALSGFSFTLDRNYDPDAQSILMPSGISLPPSYIPSATASFQLFLRVWQQELVFIPGTAVVLGDTGLQVTLATTQSAGGQDIPFHIGDFWTFAARPATPQTVYPERYSNNPQPPEGPRLWACPLAVVSWNGQQGMIASDCRNFFDNLVDLTNRQQGSGCCAISIKPQDLSNALTLQSIVDRSTNITMNVAAAVPGIYGNNITVEISNVRYDLSPLTFDITVSDSETLFATNVMFLQGPQGIGLETSNSPFLAHLVQSSVNQTPGVAPLGGRIVQFSSVGKASAQANVLAMDNSIVFTLEARGPGADGDLTEVSVTNVITSATPVTFDLSLVWTKTLRGLTMANFIQMIQTGLAYEITVTPPADRAPAVPVEGVSMLSGGGPPLAQSPATYATATIFGKPVKLCLSPGTYNLPQTLTLTNLHSNLTIEACGGEATIAAVIGQESKFQQGLVLVNEASNITLRGLTFKLPAAYVFDTSLKIAFAASVGLRPFDCQSLTIEDCNFHYPQMRSIVQFHFGVLAGGEILGLNLNGNRFIGPQNFLGTLQTFIGLSLGIFGYYQDRSSASKFGTGLSTGAADVPTILDDANISRNSFQNLSIALDAIAPIGTLRLDGNSIKSSFIGILLGIRPTPPQASQAHEPTQVKSLGGESVGLTSDMFHQGSVFAASFPAPHSTRLKPTAVATPDPADPGEIDAQISESVTKPAVSVDLSGPTLNLHVADNDIDTIITLKTSFKGGLLGVRTIGGFTALAIYGNDPREDGMLVMTGNKFRNQVDGAVPPPTGTLPDATVIVSDVSRCVITGNLILNEGAVVTDPTTGVNLPQSLLMTHIALVEPIFVNNFGNVAAAVAISGNVFRGQTTIPARFNLLSNQMALTPPITTWEAYNTEV